MERGLAPASRAVMASPSICAARFGGRCLCGSEVAKSLGIWCRGRVRVMPPTRATRSIFSRVPACVLTLLCPPDTRPLPRTLPRSTPSGHLQLASAPRSRASAGARARCFYTCCAVCCARARAPLLARGLLRRFSRAMPPSPRDCRPNELRLRRARPRARASEATM